MNGLFKRFDILFTIAVFALMVPLEKLELLSMFEYQSHSLRQPMRTQVTFSDNIVFINTDEEFFTAYESWPLKRTDIANIVKNVHDLGAEVVGVDLLFDFPNSYLEDGPAAQILSEAGEVVVVSLGVIEDGTMQRINYPVPEIREVTHSGYSNVQSASFLVEHMSRLRIFEEGMQFDDGWPFAVQVLSHYLDAEPSLSDGILRIGDDVEVPLDSHNQFLIDFPVPPVGAEKLSANHGLSALDFLDLSQHDEETLEELRYWVDGKIVLIGDTSEVSHDYFNTPVGTVYGVELIGASIDTLQRNAPLRPASLGAEIAVLMLLMIVLVASAFQSNPMPRLLVAAAAFVIWFAGVCWLYAAQGLVFTMSYAMFAGTLSFLAINLRFYLQERGQKSLIRDAFGQYLSPKVVNILVKDPTRLSLGGERREMTAYFSDVAGFSTISEQLTPEELVALLNDYLTSMCDIIADYDGTVDKFEGDAIIAFWGAPLDQPDHARLASFAAIDMQKTLIDYRIKLAQEGRPLMNVRMGLNTGDMLVGNLGSRQRMDYTIMGDAVNLAARLEGANKFYGTDTMISNFTYAHVQDDVDVRELDTIRVVGKREAVTVYQLLDRKGQMNPELAALTASYEQALNRYKAREFAAAIEQFEATLQLQPDDGPSKTYLDRCRLYLENPPPADWDGVFQLTEKG